MGSPEGSLSRLARPVLAVEPGTATPLPAPNAAPQRLEVTSRAGLASLGAIRAVPRPNPLTQARVADNPQHLGLAAEVHRPLRSEMRRHQVQERAGSWVAAAWQRFAHGESGGRSEDAEGWDLEALQRLALREAAGGPRGATGAAGVAAARKQHRRIHWKTLYGVVVFWAVITAVGFVTSAVGLASPKRVEDIRVLPSGRRSSCSPRVPERRRGTTTADIEAHYEASHQTVHRMLQAHLSAGCLPGEPAAS